MGLVAEFCPLGFNSFKGIEKLPKTQKREGDLKLAVVRQFYHVISVVARWRRLMSGWFG